MAHIECDAGIGHSNGTVVVNVDALCRRWVYPLASPARIPLSLNVSRHQKFRALAGRVNRFGSLQPLGARLPGGTM
jgi:hypothetical protein